MQTLLVDDGILISQFNNFAGNIMEQININIMDPKERGAFALQTDFAGIEIKPMMNRAFIHLI